MANKKRFQFTVRRLLFATAIIALLLALFTKSVMDYRQSATIARSIEELGGSVSWNPELHENLLRYRTVAAITDVHFSNTEIGAKQCKALSLIPNRFGLQLDGKPVTEELLGQLSGVSGMWYLVIKNASVDEADIAKFQNIRPDVEVMIGYPGDPNYRAFPPLPVPIDRTKR
jgi:hypothetical protein